MKHAKFTLYAAGILILLITSLVHAEKQPVWITNPASLYSEENISLALEKVIHLKLQRIAPME